MPGQSKRKAKKSRLSDLGPGADQDFEVSLVPVGANNRTVLLTKSLEGEKKMEEILKQILEKDLENAEALEEVIKAAKLSEDEQKTVKAAARLLNSLKGKVSESVMAELKKLAGMPDKKKKEKTKKELVEELRKEGFKIEEPAQPEGDKMDPEVKKQFDSIRKEYGSKIEAIQKENETLKDNLKKERDLRKTREFVEKSESFGYNGDEAKEVATILKSAADALDQEHYEKLEKRLKAEAAQKKVTSLFKESGSSQGGNATSEWEGELESKKADLRKEHPEWSEAKLEDAAFERNPDLYNKYLDANPAQGGR